MNTQAENLPHNNSDLIGMLQRHQIMPTSQRIHIAQVLFEKTQHLSAEQVLDEVTSRGYSISRATVYNTLGLFANKGLVSTVNLDPDRVLYDSNTRPHFHFHNQDTGELIDIDMGNIEIKSIPALPDNTTLDNIDITLQLRQCSNDSE